MSDGKIPHRIRVFVDFWNFQLSIKAIENSFTIDWTKVGSTFAESAAKDIDPNCAWSFEALHVYGSYDPAKPNDTKLKNWFVNWLDKQRGVHVVALPRQKKRGYPSCPICHVEAQKCESCGHDLRGTEEKGIDTRMVADMISLAWADAYNVAVLVSTDRDFVPVADFLQTKGIKVVHAAFPPLGSELTQKCWTSFKVPDLRDAIRRTQ